MFLSELMEIFSQIENVTPGSHQVFWVVGIVHKEPKDNGLKPLVFDSWVFLNDHKRPKRPTLNQALVTLNKEYEFERLSNLKVAFLASVYLKHFV